jgi:hypothetical protein
MPVCSDTNVISQSLSQLHTQLRQAGAELGLSIR